MKAGKVPFVHEMDGETGARLFDADVIDALAAEHKRSGNGHAA